LEVGVRPGDSTGSYTALSPRQPLTAAPYAHYARSVPWSGLTGVPSGFADGVDDDTLGGLLCASGEVAKWDGSAWSCAADADSGGDITGVTAGTGLAGGGTSGDVGLSLASTYRLPQACASGQIAEWNGSAWVCGNAAAPDHDHWGESWSGTGTGLTLSSGSVGLDASGSSTGVRGEASSSTGHGVFGLATNTTGQNYGVYGQSNSTSGRGVYGYANATSGTNYGVYGRSGSTSGRGVYGYATAVSGTTYGVYGRSDSTSGRGVYGYAQATSGTTYGVYGFASSSSGYGVYGSSAGYGVYATGNVGDIRLSDTGTIYANTSSSSNLELHSNNRVDVHLDDDDEYRVNSLFRVLNGSDTAVFTVTETGAVSWTPKTGYLSIPSVAFRPREDGYNFVNTENYLVNSDGNSDYYFAPVYLPHGATVTRMTFYWNDQSSSNGSTILFRKDLSSGSAAWMASVFSSGNSGYGSSSTTSISNPIIDNSLYTYILQWNLPDSTIWGYAVIIEYTYTGPH
ncbi:MAG TPA: hypothetical protein G4O00_11145, partial [Thermoflexia bacterium]|nr:hypothetical protein [Thermoflexia bacterium]